MQIYRWIIWTTETISLDTITIPRTLNDKQNTTHAHLAFHSVSSMLVCF